MENLNVLDFIPQSLLILVVSIYVLGIFLKKMQNVKDNYIVFILMVFGIIMAIILDLINGQYKTAYEAIVNGMLQGILCWGAAVGINQVTKQIGKDE